MNFIAKKVQGPQNSLWKRVAIVALAVVFLFVVAGFLLIANAFEGTQYEVAHTITYTQLELVELLNEAMAEPKEPDFSLIDSNHGEFELEEEVVQPDDVNAGSYQAEWVAAELEGKMLIDTVVQEDGCVAYVAIGNEEMILSVIAVNPNGESHLFKIDVEKRHEVSAEIKSFDVEPVVEETVAEPSDTTESALPESVVSSTPESVATESVTSSENKTEENKQTSSTPEGENAGGVEPAESVSPQSISPSETPVEQTDDTAQTEQQDAGQQETQEVEFPAIVFKNPVINLLSSIEPESTVASEIGTEPESKLEENKENNKENNTISQPESIVQAGNENQGQPATEEPQLVVVGFAAALENEKTQENVGNSVEMILHANGVGEISLDLGFLYGGPVPYAGEGSTLKEGTLKSALYDSNPTKNKPGSFIRIYSQGDALVNGGRIPNTSGDYLTWSGGSTHNIIYDIDANTPIIVQTATGYEERVTIELRNTKVVKLRAIDYADGGRNLNDVCVIQAVEPRTPSNPDASSLHIENKDGYVRAQPTANKAVVNYAAMEAPVLTLTGDGKIYAKGATYGYTVSNAHLDNPQACLTIENRFHLVAEGNAGAIGDDVNHTNGNDRAAYGVRDVVVDGGLLEVNSISELTRQVIFVEKALTVKNKGEVKVKGGNIGIVAESISMSNQGKMDVTPSAFSFFDITIGVQAELDIILDASTLNSNGHGIGIMARNLSAQNVSRVYVTTNLKPDSIGIKNTTAGDKLFSEVNATDKSLIHVKDAMVGIETPRVSTQDAFTLNLEYSDFTSVNEDSRTRIVAYGEDVGIKATHVTHAVYAGKGTLIYAEGKNIGMHANSQHQDLLLNTYVGRAVSFFGKLENNEFGTIIAYGTGAGSTGYYMGNPKTVDVFYVNFKTRVVAIGEKYGARFNEGTVAGDILHVNRGGEFVGYAWGENSYGIEFSSKITSLLFVDYGSRVYGRGQKAGVLMWKGDMRVYSHKWLNDKNGSEVIGVGGIPDEFMDGPATIEEYKQAFKFDDLPKAAINEADGLLKYLPVETNETYGISIGGGSYLLCAGTNSKMIGYGGKTGIEASGESTDKNEGNLTLNSILCYLGALVDGRGGYYGVRAARHLHATASGDTGVELEGLGDEQSGSAIIRGYGKNIGLYAGVDIHVYGNSKRGSHMYGYGEEHGIYAGWNVLSLINTSVVAETVIDAKITDPTNRMAKPAMAAPICDAISINPSSNSDIVEVYNVKNMPVLTKQPFDLTKLPAFYANIGQVPRMQTQFTWTTPTVNPPKYVPDATFQYTAPSYNYNPMDDSGLVGASTNGGITGGLVAKKGDVSNQVIVGSCENVFKKYRDLLLQQHLKKDEPHDPKMNAADYLYYLNSANQPDVFGLGTYRIILKEATSDMDTRLTDVELDLWEREYPQSNTPKDTDITTAIPAHVKYELKYTPPSSSGLAEAKVTLQNGRPEFKEGKLLLKKLMVGDYTLTPLTDWGAPYKQLPVIRFKLAVEKVDGVDVVAVSLPEASKHAEVVAKSVLLSATDGAGLPTFFGTAYPPNPGDKSQRIGKLRVFYMRNNNIGLAVHGTGLWQGHNTPSFSFKLEGVTGAGAGLTFHDFVSMESTQTYEKYKDFTQHGTLKFENLPDGKYKVSIVAPSLRTVPFTPDNAPDKTEKYVEIKDGVLTNPTIDFYFTYGNYTEWKTDAAYAYLSGEAAAENQFIAVK